MKKLIVTILLCMAFSVPAAAIQTDAYICIPEKSTGFRYNKTTKTWEQVRFRITEKYLVRRIKKNHYRYRAGQRWVVMNFGEEYGFAWAEKDINKYGMLFFDGYNEFRFNTEDLRFLRVGKMGYLHLNKEKEKEVELSTNYEELGTPFMEIGTCSKL